MTSNEKTKYHEAKIACTEVEIDFVKIPSGFKLIIKKIFKEKKIFQLKTLGEQVYVVSESMKDHKLKSEKKFNISDLAPIFKVKESQIYSLIDSGKNKIKKGENFTTSRPPLLTKSQDLKLINEIIDSENNTILWTIETS